MTQRHRRRIWIDRWGWPVTFYKNRPVVNVLRWLLYASLWQTWKNKAGWQREPGGGLTTRRDRLHPHVHGVQQGPAAREGDYR